jgi:hypothetical protein
MVRGKEGGGERERERERESSYDTRLAKMQVSKEKQ